MNKLTWDNVEELIKNAIKHYRKNKVKGYDAHSYEYCKLSIDDVTVRAYLDKDTGTWIGFDVETGEYETDDQQIIRCYLHESGLEWLNAPDVDMALEFEEDWILDRLKKSGD